MVRAIARPIAQLLENPIRIFSSHYAALRVQPPRATFRAEHRNRSGSLFDSIEVGLTSGASRFFAVTLRATYCVLRPPQVEASGPPMPVALRATTIVAAPGREASLVPSRT